LIKNIIKACKHTILFIKPICSFFCNFELIFSIVTALTVSYILNNRITGELYQKFLNTAASSLNSMLSLFIAILGILIVFNLQFNIDFETDKKHIARCGAYLLIGFLYFSVYNAIASMCKVSEKAISIEFAFAGLTMFLLPAFSITFLGFEVVRKFLKIQKKHDQAANKVSATIDICEMERIKVKINNLSDLPIYEMFIIGVSNKQNIMMLSAWKNYVYKECIETGTSFCFLKNTGASCGGEHLVVHIFFTDTEGIGWYRDNKGILKRTPNYKKLLSSKKIYPPY